LPEHLIGALQTIDADLSVAIVRALQSLAPQRPPGPAEMITYGARAVITVPRSRELRERTGADLVPLSDGRALMSFDDQLAIARFELALLDGLVDPTLGDETRQLFDAVAGILRDARRDSRVEVRPRQIIELRWKSARPNGKTDEGGGNS
jgi:hypothetical protein